MDDRWTWLVTGAARGLGAALVDHLVAGGHNVVATARRPDSIAQRRSSRLLAVGLDVTRPADAEAAVDQARQRFGRVDVVVNNAGYGLLGAVEEVSDAEARAVFDTNVFGVLNVIRAALPTLRDQGEGMIVNVGSLSGLRGAPGMGLYCATKHAIEGLSDALRHELRPLGIGVMVVEPGAVRTDFLAPGAMVEASHPLAAYDSGPAGVTRAVVRSGHGQQMGDPAKVAALIVEAAMADPMPARLPIGRDALDGLDAAIRDTLGQLAPWRERSAATAHLSGAAALLEF